MKNLKQISIAFIASISSFLYSCKDEIALIPINDTVATKPSTDSTNSNLSQLKVVSTNAITISNVTASLTGGGKYFTKDVDYTKYLQANNQSTSTITIKGSGFGSEIGTLVFDGGYTVTNIKWSASQISGTLNCSASSRAGEIIFSITPKGSKDKFYWSAFICPFLNTRRFGQCTFDCTAQRIIGGLTVPTPAYQKTADITGSYLAKAGDILHWSGTHQATVTNVVQDEKNKNIYTFSTREMNGQVGDGTVLTHS